MNIAFISREFPWGIQGGGIGTYMYNIAKLMNLIGHKVFVFCEGKTDDYFVEENINIYTISVSEENFQKKVLKTFEKVYSEHKIDLLESAEYKADSLLIKEKYSNIPLLVKLHSPTFLVSIYNNYFFNYVAFSFNFKGLINRIRRSYLKQKIFKYNYKQDIEYKLCKKADIILSPSKALAKVISKEWKLKKIQIIPNIYIPPKELLNQEIPTSFKRFIFIGKLSILKGLVDLANAINIVLREKNDIKFIFVGESYNSHIKSLDFENYIKNSNSEFNNNIEFYGKVELNRIPNLLSNADCLIIPSLWENFPTVCLEAMSAGKLIIGANSGGIPEMIKNCGLIFNRKKKQDLAKKILLAINKPKKMKKLAANGRIKVTKHYSIDNLKDQINKTYGLCQK